MRRGNSVGFKSQVRVLLGLHYLNTPYESESNLKCYSIAYKNPQPREFSNQNLGHFLIKGISGLNHIFEELDTHRWPVLNYLSIQISRKSNGDAQQQISDEVPCFTQY